MISLLIIQFDGQFYLIALIMVGIIIIAHYICIFKPIFLLMYFFFNLYSVHYWKSSDVIIVLLFNIRLCDFICIYLYYMYFSCHVNIKKNYEFLILAITFCYKSSKDTCDWEVSIMQYFITNAFKLLNVNFIL